MVCRLMKGLYGLKQASRLWYKKLKAALERMGFKAIYSDNSIYVYAKDQVKVILPVFVDDCTFASNSLSLLDDLVVELSRSFKLRDLGPTTALLGIEITRDRPNRRLMLSQRQYILDMLERYGQADSTPVKTPMVPGTNLSVSMAPVSSEDKEYMKKVPYISAVGSLLFLALATRPDIAHTVSVLCRFNSNPGIAHWKSVKHLFRYLRGTLDYRLVYGPTDSKELFTSFCDADHAGNPDNGRSTSGYVLRIGSGAISWSSKLQGLVAQSTTEAEFIAAVDAGREIVWMRNLLTELGYSLSEPSILRVDNQSAVAVSKNPEHHGRMKHLDLRFFWLRDQVEAGVIAPAYVPTAENAADILTKAVPPEKVKICCRLMGLEDVAH